MTTSIRTNTSAAIALQTLNRTNSQLEVTQSRVNTGLKVQGAKDNAAVWAVAQGQRADKGSLEAVTTSLNRATSLADVSLAAGEQISDLLVEMQQKATAAADPSATEATRKAYNDEFQSLLKSVQSFADNAIFDGENMLSGLINGIRPDPGDPGATPPVPPTDPATLTPLTFLASADGSETITLNRQDLSPEGLGLELEERVAAVGPPPVTARPAGPPLLDTKENAEEALAAIKTALADTNSKLAELGAQAKQVERHTTYVSKLSDSLETGIGNLVDADLAKESARLQALQVQQQLGVQALSIANQAPQMILSLFRS